MKSKELTGYPSIDMPQEMGASFLKRKPIIPDINIYSAIKMLSTFYRKNDAIDCMDLVVNYDTLLADSVIISLAFKELGVKKGDIISISMPNFYQAVASYLACNRIGAVTTFLNAGASNEEIKSYLNLFESPIFINFNKSKEENIEIKKGTSVKYIITLNKNNVNDINFNSNYRLTTDDDLIDFNSLGSIAKFQKKLPELSHRGRDNSLILFTSGSTGKPKSVVLTNKNILSVGTYLKNSSTISKIDESNTLVCVPFTYPYGFATSTLLTLMSGKLAILAPNISKDTISYYLKKNPNIVFGSPALMELIKKNVPDDQNLSSITTFISGGDFLTVKNAEDGREFFKKHGANVQIFNGSGNAETVGSGTNPVGLKIKPETVGKVLIGSTGMIYDFDNDEEKQYGEEGELCISGGNVFKEYYQEPELTKQAKFMYNGKEYFKTGTKGFLDKEGYFTLTGRSSRFYITDSLNKVYLDHIQHILGLFQPIKAVATVKVPNEDKLFVNKAYIVLNDGFSATKETEEYIISLFNQSCIDPLSNESVQLKDYEYPTYIEFIDELPRTIADKIDYSSLEEDAKKEVEKNKTLYLKPKL